jgi:hypothetical protein
MSEPQAHAEAKGLQVVACRKKQYESWRAIQDRRQASKNSSTSGGHVESFIVQH